MGVTRRSFFGRSAAALAATSCCANGAKAAEPPAGTYLWHGRTQGDPDFAVIERGRRIDRVETFHKRNIGVVRVTTDDGAQGIGQVSTYDTDVSTMMVHRKVARHVVGKDPADIDAIVDRVIEANYKYPWSFVCRALSGVDTAIWDLYGKLRARPVARLLQNHIRRRAPSEAQRSLADPMRACQVYGSSMRRDIAPQDEADRCRRLRDEEGIQAFKVRVGRVNGHNVDQWPGRSEELIRTMRAELGPEVDLLADANSGYTPDRAIEIGRLMADQDYCQFEEPCPYWELEWTRQVTRSLSIPVSGGEQDNDLATWRRMIDQRAVDIVQPDVCYIGGLTRAYRVARMAEAAGLSIVPHSANHALVTLFSLHLLAAVPNACPYLEYSIERDAGVNREATAAFDGPLKVQDGAVRVPDAPGWGVDVNPNWLESAEYKLAKS